ncbi:hypothetical protein BU52_32925 [Streptomyces toyocaensis]|uniref:Uncharacterized protein n=1 Tax=Streptomyces toyocaensis TaxID=55952 RepID=A0A081XHG9_STRTO|nr:hypothetical protein [Streptomyces toyocaensis]KES02992.1 hypothetical protein BU52_32925 [Streptomyces toyocaensis]
MPRPSCRSPAAERRRRVTEQERLAAFFEYAGMQAALWPAFMQLVRSASGKTVTCGGQSPAHGGGLLLYQQAA